MSEPAENITEIVNPNAPNIDEGLRQRMSAAEMGRAGSLRFIVLNLIVEGNYEHAAQEIDSYITSLKRFPRFMGRAGRLVGHSKDLINAIKAKRSFRNKSSLTIAKQQELMEKILEHFNELKSVLTKIERIEIEEKLQDFRSTIWVVRVFTYCVFGLAIVAALVDGFFNEWRSLYAVTDDTCSKISQFVIEKLKL